MCKDCEAKDAEIGRLNAAVESVCKGSFGASEALAKDNADLRTQLNTANAAAGEAKAALRGLFGLLEAEVIVRNTSHDHDPKWYLKSIELTQVLCKAENVLKEQV